MPADHGSPDDEDVPDDAKGHRDLPEKEESPKGREKDLGVVKDGDLPGRREFVCRGDPELPHGGCDPRRHQAQELPGAHGMEVKDQKGRRHQAGKEGKAQNDDGRPLSRPPQAPYKHIGRSGAKAAVESDEGREDADIRGGPDDKEGTDKGHHGGGDVPQGGHFL